MTPLRHHLKAAGRKPTVREALDLAARSLAPWTDGARLDAQTLLAEVTGRPRAWLIAYPESDLDPVAVEKLDRALERVNAGEPLPYVLGHWDFYGLDFELSPGVLIPRPETELLVERALAWLAAHPEKRRAADVGAGSGCIGVTLAVHVPDLAVRAIDISQEALAIGEKNARWRHVEDRIAFTRGDLLAEEPGPFDLICANLPYIPTATLHALPVFGREPELALDGGADGLDHIRRLLAQAATRLAQDGLLLIEIEASQGPAVQVIAQAAFPGAGVRVHRDLSGRDRLVEVNRRGRASTDGTDRHR